MIRKIFCLTVMCIGLAMPGVADTRTGRANTASVQLWQVVPAGDGQLQITLSWGKGGADLAMVAVCGAEPFVLPWGAALGGLNRVAELNVGVISDVPCLVGVSSLRQSSAYRIHFQHAKSQTSKARGRELLETTVGEGQVGSALAREVERQMAQLRRLAILR